MSDLPRNGVPRAFFAAGLFMAWLSYNDVLSVDGLPYPRGLAAWVDLSWLVTPGAVAVQTAVFVAALFAWATRRSPEVAAAVLSVLLIVAEQLHMSQWDEDIGGNKAAVLPAAAMIGWVVTAAWARRRGRSADEAEVLGYEAACALAAACYFLAGAAKIDASGLMWASGSNLALHITVHAYNGVAWLMPFRLAVAEHLWLCTIFGVGTLIVECGYVFFLVPWMRKPLSIAATGMHLAIGLVMGLHHYDWMFVEIGLAFYATRRR